MTSPRKQRARLNRIFRVMRRRRLDCELEDQMWNRMPAVGREFGSPDFERLMEDDHCSSGASLIQQLLRGSNLAEGPNCKVTAMTRVRVAPGKFVTIPTELAEKAARVFRAGFTRDQVLEFKESEPRHVAGPMAGSRKPLTIAKSWAAVMRREAD
jgi:hypothetical protein